MKVGDLVIHEYWGKGIIVQQQGVINRWLVRWFNTCKNGRWDVVGVSGYTLEVISGSR